MKLKKASVFYRQIFLLNRKTKKRKKKKPTKKIFYEKDLDEVLGRIKLGKDAKKYINEMCDIFIENICYSGCLVSKNRDSDILEVNDVKLALKAEFNIDFPEAAFQRKTYLIDSEHEKKVQNIEKENFKRSRM